MNDTTKKAMTLEQVSSWLRGGVLNMNRLHAMADAIDAHLSSQHEGEAVAWIYRDEPYFDGKEWKDQWRTTTNEELAKYKDKSARPLYEAHPHPRREVPSDKNNYKEMFESAVLALADIDRLLGLPEDGCNDPQITVSALADFIAGHKEMQKSRDEWIDAAYAAVAGSGHTELTDRMVERAMNAIYNHRGFSIGIDGFLVHEAMRAALEAALSEKGHE